MRARIRELSSRGYPAKADRDITKPNVCLSPEGLERPGQSVENVSWRTYNEMAHRTGKGRGDRLQPEHAATAQPGLPATRERFHNKNTSR